MEPLPLRMVKGQIILVILVMKGTEVLRIPLVIQKRMAAKAMKAAKGLAKVRTLRQLTRIMFRPSLISNGKVKARLKILILSRVRRSCLDLQRA